VVFSLLRTRVEHPEAEEALESEYLPAAESPQAEPARRRQPWVVEVEGPLQVLRAVETLRLLSGGLLKLRRRQSKNTNAAVAGKLAVSVALVFLLPPLAYASYGGGPGTPLRASLLISNEIL
jgi:hypothetical protein